MKVHGLREHVLWASQYLFDYALFIVVTSCMFGTALAFQMRLFTQSRFVDGTPTVDRSLIELFVVHLC